MSYYPTIDAALARAREILGGNVGFIPAADEYAAYKLLESFISEIERLNQLCLDIRADAHGDGQMHAIADVNAGRVDALIAPRLAPLRADATAAWAAHAEIVCEVAKLKGELSAAHEENDDIRETISGLKARIAETQQQVLDQQGRAENAELGFWPIRPLPDIWRNEAQGLRHMTGETGYASALQHCATALEATLAAAPRTGCPGYKPDHNGECLNCDEPADAHAYIVNCPNCGKPAPDLRAAYMQQALRDIASADETSTLQVAVAIAKDALK